MFGWIAAISRPSLIMPSASTVVAFTSPLIGPSTIVVISLMTSLKSVSYPHLDVYKRQVQPVSSLLFSVSLLWRSHYYLKLNNERKHHLRVPLIICKKQEVEAARKHLAASTFFCITRTAICLVNPSCLQIKSLNNIFCFSPFRQSMIYYLSGLISFS